MRFKKLSVLVLIIFCILFSAGQVKANDIYTEVTVKDTSEDVEIKIVPRMELLAGVLSQTSWIEERGPQGRGNKYFRDLKKFFAPYKEHEAVKIAQKLTNRGFTYDAPPNFILSLGGLPDLELKNDYSDYLLRRAKGRKILENFRAALIDLAQGSNFQSFWAEHRDNLKSYLRSSAKHFAAEKVIDWERNFFGWTGDAFHLIFAPAMFPGGGYGAHIETANGEQIFYQVIRAKGNTSNEPQFSTGISLELLALHEWGHSFVNPSLKKYVDLRKKLNLNEFYEPVQNTMKEQAYTDPKFFFNEQVLRAVVTLAAKDLYGNRLYKERLDYQQERGFYLTKFTVKQLEYYRKHREKYKNFKQFVPYLFKKYDQNREMLLEEISKTDLKESNGSNLFPVAILIVSLVIIVGIFIIVKFKLKEE